MRKYNKCGYSLIELLMYTALLGLVMSFIAIIFRHMLWRDRLEKYLEEHLKLKNAADMVCETLKSASKVIRPESGAFSSKIIVLKNDGTYQKIGMYRVGNSAAFISRGANSIEELDADTDYDVAANIYSKYVKKFYAARPFYNHIIFKTESANNSLLSALNLDSLRVPSPLLCYKDYYREYRNEFTQGSGVVNVSEKLSSNYYKSKSSFNASMIDSKAVDKFMSDFDKYSGSAEPLRAKSILKKFIKKDGADDIGRVIFYTAYLIEKASVEICIANGKRQLISADKDVSGTALDIFGADVIMDYELCMAKIASASRNGLSIKPDYKTLFYEARRVCDYNKKSLMTQMGIATPYTGSISDEKGNAVNVINLHYGKTVPLSPGDVNIFSEIEGCPPFNSPDASFSSIYQVIDSKLPYLDEKNTFIQNLDVLMYASKNIKKVTVYSNKVDIFDHKIKFGLKITFGGREFDLAFFIRQAAEMALNELPDTSKIIPIPLSAK